MFSTILIFSHDQIMKKHMNPMSQFVSKCASDGCDLRPKFRPNEYAPCMWCCIYLRKNNVRCWTIILIISMHVTHKRMQWHIVCHVHLFCICSIHVIYCMRVTVHVFHNHIYLSMIITNTSIKCTTKSSSITWIFTQFTSWIFIFAIISPSIFVAYATLFWITVSTTMAWLILPCTRMFFFFFTIFSFIFTVTFTTLC